MNWKHRPLMALAVLAALLPAPGSLTTASVFLKEDVRSLRQASESVVHAKVVDIRSYWNTARSMIFTDVTLDVKGRLHGASEDRMVVRVPGGTVADYTVEMQGAPEFEMDGEFVVFIGRWQDGAAMVAGYFQGLSRIERDRLGNAMLRGGVADGRALSDLARELRQGAR
ncbi:MAG TPA: hypothetical protein VFP98_09465 [Candidatus Polarisedimenticolia bacterium]|nr:hypothetical protein [Candidatus Polarisedimenticolia bacterium]